MTRIPFIDAQTISACLSYRELVAGLELALAQDHVVPERLHHDIGKHWNLNAHMLLMLAWRADYYLGLKVVNLYPDNVRHGLPALSGVFVLFDGGTGRPLAVLDGAELTAFRTAAASMFASGYLAQRAPHSILIIGAGNLSSYFIDAYVEVFRPSQILVWNRDLEKAEKTIEKKQFGQTKLGVAENLEVAAREADMITTLTSSHEPVLRGAWCKSGSHIDLVGGYRPDMREADDELMQRAAIFVDTYGGALTEAGDIMGPLERGIIFRSDIKAEMADLPAYDVSQATKDKDLTVFKSVGAGFEDLAAAVLVYEKAIKSA